MSETPLRRYLVDTSQKAEEFAAAHELSPWSVRHWARGDKLPNLDGQRKLETATDGVVTPAAWLEFSLARTALCGACELLAESPEVACCTRTDCPMRAPEQTGRAALAQEAA